MSLVFTVFDDAPVCATVASIMILIINILFSTSVKKTAEKRELDDGICWAVLTFIFGAPMFVAFFAFNYGLGNNKKVNLKKHAILILVAALSLVALMPVLKYEGIKRDGHLYYFSFTEPYKTIYDKERNKFPYGYTEERKYYTEVGETYAKKQTDELNDLNVEYLSFAEFFSDEYFNIKTGEAVSENDAYINENGYFVIKDYETLKHCTAADDMGEHVLFSYDADGNIYYNPDDCSWDKKGNFIIIDKRIQKLTKTYKNKLKGD